MMLRFLLPPHRACGSFGLLQAIQGPVSHMNDSHACLLQLAMRGSGGMEAHTAMVVGTRSLV
jgi:hypothetical protein